MVVPTVLPLWYTNAKTMKNRKTTHRFTIQQAQDEIVLHVFTVNDVRLKIESIQMENYMQ